MPALSPLLRALALLACAALAHAEPAQRPDWAGAAARLSVLAQDGRALAVVDEARLQVVARVGTRAGLLDEPRIAPDGRHVLAGTRDGWVMKIDLWRQQVVAETRVALALHALALSGDGRWVLAAGDEPPTLALLDADLRLAKSFPLATLDGKASTRVAALRDAARRASFIATLRDIPEVWEISYDRQAAPIHDGLVHDYRLGEALPRPGYLGVRRTPLAAPLGGFVLDQGERHLIGARLATGGAQVVNLDARVKITDLALASSPGLAGATAFDWNGTPALASASTQGAALEVHELKTGRRVRAIALPGAGVFVTGHAASPYLWAGSVASAGAQGGEGALTLVDRRTLEPAARLDVPGGAPAGARFTHDARHVLVRVDGPPAALLAYDAATFEPVARVPLPAPGGAATVPAGPARVSP